MVFQPPARLAALGRKRMVRQEVIQAVEVCPSKDNKGLDSHTRIDVLV
jgi:hypothetical protein